MAAHATRHTPHATRVVVFALVRQRRFARHDPDSRPYSSRILSPIQQGRCPVSRPLHQRGLGPTTRLPDFPTARLPDCPTARLPDCPRHSAPESPRHVEASCVDRKNLESLDVDPRHRYAHEMRSHLRRGEESALMTRYREPIHTPQARAGDPTPAILEPVIGALLSYFLSFRFPCAYA
jgi:hypothetical protein